MRNRWWSASKGIGVLSYEDVGVGREGEVRGGVDREEVLARMPSQVTLLVVVEVEVAEVLDGRAANSHCVVDVLTECSIVQSGVDWIVG